MRRQDGFIIAQRNRFDRRDYLAAFIVTHDSRYAHRLFQTGETRVVIVQRGNVIRARLIQRKLRIQDIQVDADAGAIADACDLVRFPRLFYRLRGGLNPFFRAADISSRPASHPVRFDRAPADRFLPPRRGPL